MLSFGRAFFLFFSLVVLSAAGCDCAGPLPSRARCSTSADCSRGQTCRDGMCQVSTVRDGDVDIDAFVPGYDAGPIPMPVSVRLEPAMADLVSIDGAVVTQTFDVVVVYDTGLELPASGPLFEIDTRTMGDIAPSTGLFTANGIVGGSATVTARVTIGSGPALTATAPLTVRIERTVLAAGAPADAAARFDAATPVADGSRAAGIVYPLDHVVFPENVYPADVQWTNGSTDDLFRVRITKASAEITGYVLFDGQNHWLVDLLAWRSLAQSNPGEEATLTVDRLLPTGELITGTPVALTFAQAALTGTVYYWDIVAGRIQRINDGSGTAESFLPNPEQGCVGCHSVSHSGRYMAGRLGGGDNLGTVFDLTTDLTTAVPSPSIWAPTTHGLYWWFSTWSPDDTRLIVAAQTGPELRLYDPIAGTQVPAPTLAGLFGTYPAWSPDGTRIAYIINNNTWGDDVSLGDIAILPVTAPDTFGSPSIIHHGVDIADGAADSYPTWSPDSSLIAFGHGTGSRSESRLGDLFIMGADGASARQLAMAASGTREDFQPRFSPFTQGGYFWLSFLSRRVYGNPQIGNFTSAPSRRQQIWVTAVRVGAAGTEDPSSVPYWLPGQNPHSANISAYWAPRACRPDGDACSVGSECCGGECLVDGTGALVCAPPPPDRCREYGETCTTDGDCCMDMDLECRDHVCVHPGPG
jgi:hypothetical protein